MLEALSRFYWPTSRGWERGRDTVRFRIPMSPAHTSMALIAPLVRLGHRPPARAWLATPVLCHMHHLRSVASDALWPRGAMAVALGGVVDDRGGPGHLGPACSLVESRVGCGPS